MNFSPLSIRMQHRTTGEEKELEKLKNEAIKIVQKICICGREREKCRKSKIGSLTCLSYKNISSLRTLLAFIFVFSRSVTPECSNCALLILFPSCVFWTFKLFYVSICCAVRMNCVDSLIFYTAKTARSKVQRIVTRYRAGQ